MRIGGRWAVDLMMGGLIGPSRSNYLLDTGPLRELLERELQCARLAAHLESGLLRGIAVSATNYLTGCTVSFYQSVPTVSPWVRRGRVAQPSRIAVNHVLASSAIPVFFPPVVIDDKIYGDGGIRLTTPLSPAIHLGAEKLLAVGIRVRRTPEHTIAMNRDMRGKTVSMAGIAGVLLNAVFIDALENDVERLQRVNRTLALLSPEERERNPDSLRPIPTLVLRPTEDLGHLAADQYETAEMRRDLAEREGEVEAARIGRVGEALKRYPSFLQYDLQARMPEIYRQAGAQGNLVITAPAPAVFVTTKGVSRSSPAGLPPATVSVKHATGTPVTFTEAADGAPVSTSAN